MIDQPADGGTPWASRAARRRASALIGPESAKSAVAKKIRYGTSQANTRDGVSSSSQAPMTPPANDGSVPRTIQSRSPVSSRRKPWSAATEPGDSDTVLVAFARIGSRPSQTRTGNVISEPPPAIELIAPATV